MASLTGKTALITGGGSGIGLATAHALFDAGAAIALAGRDERKLQAARESLGDDARVSIHRCDVADAQQATALVASVTQRHGAIDLLINNAGVNTPRRSLADLDAKTWDELIRVNLNGTFYVSAAVLPAMRARRDGVIVNINSVVGKRANLLGGAAYNAAKFGMAALGLTIGAEEKDANIRVTNIYPGEVDTAFLDFRPKPVTPEQRSRILQADDVATAVLFVCTLPPRARVPELVMVPTGHAYY